MSNARPATPFHPTRRVLGAVPAAGWLALALAVAEPAASAQQPRPPDVAPAASVEVVAHRSLELEGFVLGPDGAPAEGAVVVSSAGGQAVTDAAGRYRLGIRVSPDVTDVQVTAVGRTSGGPSASTRVTAMPDTVRVPPLALALGASCTAGWLPAFGQQPGTDGAILALAVYDDGSGPALYAGGFFGYAGNVEAMRIGKWDGESWTPLGAGPNSNVRALVVYDDGSGPALYAGGDFSTAGGIPASRVAKWDGSSWSAVGAGVNDQVHALVVHDDGTGAALYAGGRFTLTGSAPARRVARWNGVTWSALGFGITALSGNPIVRALAVHDDGSGPALYAGGEFTVADGGGVQRIARWDGTGWADVGGGMDAEVFCLIVHDDGAGPALFAGGWFQDAGGAAAAHIARWDGSAWTPLAAGTSSGVFAMGVYDDGGGPALYVKDAGIAPLSRWDGASWTTLSTAFVAPVSAFAVYDDGSGPVLYAGGSFAFAGDLPANHFARWDGSGWSVPMQGGSNGLNRSVSALTVYDDGGGPALYAGGLFTAAGGVAANLIARCHNGVWSALGSGLDNSVLALQVYDDGGGPALYATGRFTTAGGVPASRVAKWDGASWAPLGSGLGVTAVGVAMTVFDDGAGPALYVGGIFTTAGGVPASRIARWDGASWSALGSGLNDQVASMTVHDDGSGPALFVGGYFSSAGGIPASHVARWNGASWSAIGGTLHGVTALTVFDDGAGPALFAGTNRLMRWHGTGWTLLGGTANGSLSTFLLHDDGRGPALFAGGDFTSVSGVAANRIAKWDGSGWTPCGSGLSAPVAILATFDDGGGPALFVGGEFDTAFDSGDSYLAKWGCGPDVTPPVLDCPPVYAAESLTGPPGEVVHFTVTAIDDRDPSPVVTCVPPSGSAFPPGTTLVDCTATDDAGNESTCQFTVTVMRKTRER